ncbi:glutathione peroxidase [Undibacterium squillarum]|uniref:Glutathione peroxidase n=1 Tax=Undibacterium squillarum TaxID=1131567 RepID=A0ABQ2Y069_9BURK|nr:glutathione peroxidase [Undibacterium squillarum]GGX46206.1 glutathione peroxidase [Undibacterium squillarum]
MQTLDFTVNDLQGRPVDLKQYAGKVVLVVNTASRCGFTPQYEGLERLYQTYRDQGLVVLGFPCNQFGHQEPGEATEIAQFCELRFGVSFPLFEKIEVNGKAAHPFYQQLKSAAPGLLGTEAIKWNFTKFLIDRHGKVVRRYAPQSKPEELESAIRELLGLGI